MITAAEITKYIQRFKLYYPHLANNVHKFCYDPDLDELIFISDDNSLWCYEDKNNTIHCISDNYKDISDDKYKKEFGRRLQKIMLKKRITQDALTEKTGISQCRISNYINGISVPSFINAIKIADALHYSVDIFSLTNISNCDFLKGEL